MKRKVAYKELEAWRDITLKLVRKASDPRIVAVPRGGLTMAHLLAWRAGLPVMYFDTHTNTIIGSPQHLQSLSTQSTLFFVEDLIAEGRTYAAVRDMVRSMTGLFFGVAHYCVYLVDPQAQPLLGDPKLPIHWHEMTRDWLVFPWEEYDLINEDDRGLFREGTSQAAQLKDSTL